MRRLFFAVGSLRFFGGDLRPTASAASGQDKQAFWGVKPRKYLRFSIFELRWARNVRRR
jgi:hypothetical protein